MSFQLPVGGTSVADTKREAFNVVDIGTATATLTAAQVLAGIMHSTPAAAATFTFPTAALMVAGDAKAESGTGILFSLRNDDGVNAITVAAGTNGTLQGSATVAANAASMWYLRYTNVAAGNEAYTLTRMA